MNHNAGQSFRYRLSKRLTDRSFCVVNRMCLLLRGRFVDPTVGQSVEYGVIGFGCCCDGNRCLLVDIYSLGQSDFLRHIMIVRCEDQLGGFNMYQIGMLDCETHDNIVCWTAEK